MSLSRTLEVGLVILPLDNVVDLVQFQPPLDEKKLLHIVHDWRLRHPALPHAGAPRIDGIWLSAESAEEWAKAFGPDDRVFRSGIPIVDDPVEGAPGVNVELKPLFCLPLGWVILEGKFA